MMNFPINNLRNNIVTHIFVTILLQIMDLRRDVFQAIADPTRRSILALLAFQSLSLNAVAGHYSISRPAISKHIKILEECDLVEIIPIGRERYCHAKLEKLNEVAIWVDQYKNFWENKLTDLEKYINQIQNKKNGK
jgi:DNA-binding transcriptional ArsR family regulator